MSYIGIVFFALSILVASANLCVFVDARLRQRRSVKPRFVPVPFASLAFGFLAWFKARGILGLAAFLPALLDPGTWGIIPLWYRYWARRSTHPRRHRRMKQPPIPPD